MSTHRPNHKCECGNTLFDKKTFDFVDGALVNVCLWECTNCLRTLPRISRKRRSNRMRALDAYDTLKAQWQEVDEELLALVDAGAIKYGAKILHGSLDNYHLGKLIRSEKPLTNWELDYHTQGASEELAKAKAFIAQVKGTN